MKVITTMQVFKDLPEISPAPNEHIIYIIDSAFAGSLGRKATACYSTSFSYRDVKLIQPRGPDKGH